MSPALLILAGLAGAGPQAGWVKPEQDTLSRYFGTRFKIDIARFEMLRGNPEEWTIPYITKDGGRAFVGTRTGALYAIELSTGEVLFKREDLGAIGLAMFEHRGALVVGSDSDLVALDQQTGEDEWRMSLGARIGGEIAVDGDLALLPIRPNAVVAVDLAGRKERWRQKRATPEGITVRGQAQPTIDRARGWAYLGYSDGTLLAVTLDGGDIIWTATLGKPREFFADVDARPLLVDNGRALLVASYNGGFFKVDAATGQQLWRRDIPRISALVDAGQGLLVATTDRQVLGIYRESGRIRWRYRLKRGWPTTPVNVGHQMVAVGASDGPIAFLDLETGRPKQLVSLGRGASVRPGYRDPEMVVVSNEGAILGLRYGEGLGITR